uniref:Uncharacterized protein n=1 Tax=Populus alba TaxID=43335 RepID=A0A4U5PS97_POPAL|nr:hypothetical protein D5086_0000186280 [Populus alba]
MGDIYQQILIRLMKPFKVEEAETVNVPPPSTEKSSLSRKPTLILFMDGSSKWGHLCIVVLAHSLICIRLMELQILMQLESASEKGVKRFVYISSADFGLANYLLQGYYEGKSCPKTFGSGRLVKFPSGLGFIYGTRNVGSVKLPLGVIGSPLEMVNSGASFSVRLVAVATQKFVADVATDALQQCKARPAPVVKDKRDKAAKGKAPNFDNGGSVEGTE